jgi:hypothetical protein
MTMTESIYRVTEVIGTSTASWEDAAKSYDAPRRNPARPGSAESWLDLTVEDSKIALPRQVNISFVRT